MSEEANVVYVKAKSINDVTRLNVQSINEVNEVVSSNNKMHIYEQQALQHVNTAEHYADIALNSSQESLSNSNKAEIWAEGTDEEVQALGGEHSSKRWAEILAGGIGGQWGTIIGNITEQYDLMEQLDSKANTSYVEELVTGFEEALDNKVSSDGLNEIYSALNEFNEALESTQEQKQDKLTAGENITISNNVVSAKGGDKLYDKITNCILSMPNDAVDNQFGTTFYISPDIKALIPNGFNEDGTYNNIEWTNEKERMQAVAFFGDGTHLIYKPDTNQLLHSHFLGSFAEAPEITGSNGSYYNTTENVFYLNGTTHWYPVNIVFLAELTVTDGVITTFEPKKPVKLVTYDDIKDNVYITETYQNGTSWYRIYSDGWCEQGGKFISNSDGTNWKTVNLLVSYRDNSYFVNSCKISAYTSGSGSSHEYVMATANPIRNENQTKSSFQIFLYPSGSAFWEVKGYIE